MSKVKPEKFGKSRPKVTPDDLEGGDYLVLTIAKFGEEVFTDGETGGTPRPTAYLEFKETGDKVLWLGVTQVRYLVERLGDESDDWIGEKCPVEIVTPTFAGKMQPPKCWVAEPKEWDRMLGVQRRTTPARRPPGAAKVKRAARRGR